MLTAFFGYVTELTCLVLLFTSFFLIPPPAPACTCECKCGRKNRIPAVFPSAGDASIKQSTTTEPESSKSVTDKEPRQPAKALEEQLSHPIEQQQQRGLKPPIGVETPQPIIPSIENAEKPIEFQKSTKSIEPIETPVKEEPLATPVPQDKESGWDASAPTERQIHSDPSVGGRFGDWEAEGEVNEKTVENNYDGRNTEPFKSPTSRILDSLDDSTSSYRAVEDSQDGESLEYSRSPAKSETRSAISRPAFNGRPLPPHQVRSTDTFDHGYDYRSSIETSSYASKRKIELPVCKPCNKQFKSAAALQQHTQAVHSSPLFNKQSRSRMSSPEFSTHPPAPGSVTSSAGRPKSSFDDGFHSPYMCEICNEDYHSAYDLRQHKMEKHPWAMLCPECLVTFAHAHEARDHYELVHGSEPASVIRTQRMLDTIHSSTPSSRVPSASSSASNYAESTYATHAAKPPQYRILASYDSHVVQAEHRCQQCDMVFPNAMDLRAHVNSPFSHGGEKLTPDNFPPLGSTPVAPSSESVSQHNPIAPYASSSQPAWDTSMPSFVLAARLSSNRQRFNNAISPEAKLTPDDNPPEIEAEEAVPKLVETKAVVENTPAIEHEDVAREADEKVEDKNTEHERERQVELETETEIEQVHKHEQRSEHGLDVEPDYVATLEPVVADEHHCEVEMFDAAEPPAAPEPIMKDRTGEAIQDEQSGQASQLEHGEQVHNHAQSSGSAIITGPETSSEPAPRDNTFKYNHPLPPQSKAAKKAMARQLYRNAPKQPKQPKKSKSKQKTQELFESDEDVDFELPSDFEQLTGQASEFGVSVTFIDEASRPSKKEINVQDDLASSNGLPKSLYSTARAKLDLPPATYQDESDEEEASGVVIEKEVTAMAPEPPTPAFDEEVIEIRRTIYIPRYDDYSDDEEKPEVDGASAEKQTPVIQSNQSKDATQEEEQKKDAQAPFTEPTVSSTFEAPIVTDMPEMVERLFVTDVNPADIASPEPLVHAATYEELPEKAYSSNTVAEEPSGPSSGLQQYQHFSETTMPSAAIEIIRPAEAVEGTKAADEVTAEQAPLPSDPAFAEIDAENDVRVEATSPSEAIAQSVEAFSGTEQDGLIGEAIEADTARQIDDDVEIQTTAESEATAAQPVEATNGTEHEGLIGEATEADASREVDDNAESKTPPELSQVDTSFTPAAPLQSLSHSSGLPYSRDEFAQPIATHDQASNLVDALQSNHPDNPKRSAVTHSPEQPAESMQIASSASPVMEGAGAGVAREEELAAIEAEEAARAAQALAEAEAEFAAAAAVAPAITEDEPSMIGNIEFSVPSFTFSESNTATITSAPLSLSTSEEHEEGTVEARTAESEQLIPSIAPADDDHWAESEEVYRIAIANRARPPLNLAPIRDRDSYEDDSRSFRFPPNRRINNHGPIRKRNSTGSNGWGPKPIPRPFKNSTNALEKMRSARAEVEDERAKDRERRKGTTSVRSSSFNGVDESGWISMDPKSYHNDRYGGSAGRYGDDGDSGWSPNDRQGSRQGWDDNRRASFSNSTTVSPPQNNNWGSLPGVTDGDTGGW